MRGLAGCELSLDPSLSPLERFYVRCLGVPITGLRIRLRRVLPRTRGHFEKILDAGCGPGVFTMQLAKQHLTAEVVGIDIDEEAVKLANGIAEQAGLANCRFEVGDVTNLGFQNEFDLVVSVDNLEHIEDDMLALENLTTALRLGGRLVVHTPGYHRRWLVFGRRVNFDVPGHVRPGYHIDDLTAKLRVAGLDVVDVSATYGILETFANNISYLITGADRQHKHIYALLFPLLLAVSFFGKSAKPEWGAGVLATAQRREDEVS